MTLYLQSYTAHILKSPNPPHDRPWGFVKHKGAEQGDEDLGYLRQRALSFRLGKHVCQGASGNRGNSGQATEEQWSTMGVVPFLLMSVFSPLPGHFLSASAGG